VSGAGIIIVYIYYIGNNGNKFVQLFLRDIGGGTGTPGKSYYYNNTYNID